MRRLSAVPAGIVAAVAVTVLVLGWGFDVAAVRNLFSGDRGMAVSTAVGLLGCALLIPMRTLRPLRVMPGARRVGAVLLLALAVADLALLVSPLDLPIDRLLFQFPGPRGQIYMSPASASCLALAAGCLLIRRRRGRVVNGDLFALLALVGLALTTLGLIGYLFDSIALSRVFVFSAMAAHTAAGFLLIFIALLMSRPTWGWMLLVIGPGGGGATLRRTLPFVVLGPIVFCGITLLAVDAQIIDENFRLSILAVVTVGSLVALLLWSAQRENADERQLLQSNTRLRHALRDREVLLREVYHRVKNNLQFIDAMLALEALNGNDGTLKGSLDGIRARVHAIGLVHQKLISGQDLASVELRGFLEDLCRHQSVAAGIDARGIRVDVVATPMRISLEQAIPVGLLVTELLSNAVKYAFPEGRSGTITVTAAPRDDDVLYLCVADDGVGFSGEPEERRTVGSLILRSLTGQLKAQMQRSGEAGCRVEFTIPLRSA